MPSVSLESIISTLFTAPAEASTQAEKKYLVIWQDYLAGILKEVTALAGVLPPEQITKLIDARVGLAPVLKFQAAIDVGVTMRVASVEQKQGEVSVGVQVSVLQAAGSFGFMSQATQESVLQARASYTLANFDAVTLKQYLAPAQLTLASPADLTTAVDYLKKKAA